MFLTTLIALMTFIYNILHSDTSYHIMRFYNNI